MNTLWQVPVVVAALLTWLSHPPDSLADAADREALRRTLTPKATRVYTNQDLPETGLSDESLIVPAGPNLMPVALVIPGTGTAVEPVKDESWWRSRVQAARAALERDELMADAMQSRVNLLTSQVVGRDDPFQRQQIRESLQKAIEELDRLQKIVLADRTALEDIQTDARLNSIPPGWVR